MIAPKDLTKEGSVPDSTDAAELSPVSATPEAPQRSIKNRAIPDSLRLVGYALILLLGIKLASGLSWGAFTVPTQRLGLASTLTEAAPFLLLALGLIFAGGNGARRRQEIPVLVVLQRLLLPLAIGFALLAPLVITDAFRAYQAADQQGAVLLQQARQFRRQVLDAIKPTASAAELAQELRKFPQIQSSINPSQPLDSIKKELFVLLDKGIATIESQRADQLSGTRSVLVKRTIVTALLTLITAIFLHLLREQNLVQVQKEKMTLKSYFSKNLFEPLRPFVGPHRSQSVPGSDPVTGWLQKLFRPDPTKLPKRPFIPPKQTRLPGSGPPSFWQKLWAGSPRQPRPKRPPKPPKRPPKPPKRPLG